MGFYGNITNQASTQFKFDKIYNNRAEMDASVNSDGVYIGRYALVEYGDGTKIYQDSMTRAYFPQTGEDGLIKLYNSGSAPTEANEIIIKAATDTSTIKSNECKLGTTLYVLGEDSGAITRCNYIAEPSKKEITGSNPTKYTITKDYYILNNEQKQQKTLWTRVEYTEAAKDQIVARMQKEINAHEKFYYALSGNTFTYAETINAATLVDSTKGYWELKDVEGTLNIATAGTEWNSTNDYFTINREQLYYATTYYYATNAGGTDHFIKVDFPSSIDVSGDTGGISGYVYNYNIDIAAYPGASRGYDSTVWQKVFENNTAKYVMIAELNSVVPTFDITADAPTISPMAPHFDADSTNVYYKLHTQPSWGLRLKSNDTYLINHLDENGEVLPNFSREYSSTDVKQYPSDLKTSWIKDEYNKNDAQEHKYIFEVTNTSANKGGRDVNYGQWTAYSNEEQEGKLDAAVYWNKAGMDALIDHKASDETVAGWDSTVNEIKVEPTGQSGHRYNTHGGSNKAVQEDIQEISVMLPALGDAVSEMWDMVYGDREQNKIVNIDGDALIYRKDEDGNFIRNHDIDWRARTDNTDIEDDDRLRGAFDQFGNVRSYDSDNNAINTLAGCINSVHDLMGMIVRVDEPVNDAQDESSIYYYQNEYKRLQPKYEESGTKTSKLDILNPGTNGANKKKYYYRIGNSYFKAGADTPSKYNYYNIKPEYFEEKTLHATWTPNTYWKLTNPADEGKAATSLIYELATNRETDAVYRIPNTEIVKGESRYFYIPGSSTQVFDYIDDETTHKRYKQVVNKGYFYINEDSDAEQYRYEKDNSVSKDTYRANTYYIKSSELNYTFAIDSSSTYDETKTYYNRKERYTVSLANEIIKKIDNNDYRYFSAGSNKEQVINYTYKLKGKNYNDPKTDWSSVNWNSLTDNDWYLEYEDYSDPTYWNYIYPLSFVNTQHLVGSTWVDYDNYYFELSKKNTADDRNNKCTGLIMSKIKSDNPNYLLCGKEFKNIIVPEFDSESIDLYQPDVYYYTDADDETHRTYWKIDGKDYSDSLPTGRTYYQLKRTITDNDIVAGPKKNKYYFDSHATYYDVDGNEITNHTYSSSTDYYQLNALYVVESTNPAFLVGEEFNGELLSDNYYHLVQVSGSTTQFELYKSDNVTKLEGIKLSYLKQNGYIGVTLEDFAKKLNTIHGLLLQFNKVLGMKRDVDNPIEFEKYNTYDGSANPYENYLGPIDTDTVYGCIDKMKDIINKIEGLTPGDVTIVDEYGRVHGAAQTSAQGYGYTNVGKPSASQAVGAEAEDQYIYWNIDTDKDNPKVTIKHQKHSVTDTTTVADKNTQSTSDSGLNTGVGDTMKLYTPIVDNMGHIVGKNTETVTLPYGFKTIKSNGRGSATADNTANPSHSDIVADNTQDTLTIDSGNKWIKIETDAANDKMTISHDIHNFTSGAANTLYGLASNETIATLDTDNTFEVPNFKFDIAGHITAAETHTVVLPENFTKISVTAASSGVTDLTYASGDIVADNLTDVMTITPYNKWVKLSVDSTNDKLTIGHEVHNIPTVNGTNITDRKFGDSITVRDFAHDEAGHFSSKGTHTINIPGLKVTDATTNGADVVTALSFTNGTEGNIATSRTNIGALKLTGYSVKETPTNGVSYKVAASDTLNDAIGKLQGDINLLNANSNTTGSVDQKISTAIANVVGGAPAAFDTLVEIADWITKDANGNNADGFDAATRITNLETNLSNEITRAKGVEGTLSSLTTEAKGNLVAAINELESNSNTIASNLSTTNTNLQGSISTGDANTLAAAKSYTDSSISALSLGTMSQKTATDYLLVSDYKIPAAPTTAGTYTLQVVVAADGTATYSWI